MIFPATEAISEYLQTKGIRCKIDELEDASIIRIPFSGKNVTNIILYLQSRDASMAVSIRTMPLARVPEDRTAALLQVLNACNQKFRYLKFIMNNERDILAVYDIAAHRSVEDNGPVCEEILARSMAILDECHPEIMKAIYAEFVL